MTGMNCQKMVCTEVMLQLRLILNCVGCITRILKNESLVVSSFFRFDYSKRKWDNSIPTKTEDLDWDELTAKQQEAAMVFGYTESRWNNSEQASS